jgi:hypothetical protein
MKKMMQEKKLLLIVIVVIVRPVQGFRPFVRGAFNPFKVALYARLELALCVPDGSGASPYYRCNCDRFLEHICKIL